MLFLFTSPTLLQLGPHRREVDHVGARLRPADRGAALGRRREAALAGLALAADRPVALQALQVGPLPGPRHRVPLGRAQAQVPPCEVDDYPAAEDGRALTAAIPAPGPASGLITSACSHP